MRRGYKAFLKGTATDLPTTGLKLAPPRKAELLFANVRKWNKVISSAEH